MIHIVAQVVHVYDPPPDRYDYQSPSLAECLQFFPSLADLDIRWSNIYSRYQVTQSEIGPYGAELYLFTALQHHLGQSQRDSMDLTTDGLGLDAEPERQASPLELDLFHIQGIVNDFRPLFQCDSDPDSLPMSIPFEWCSPKVKALVDILIGHHSPTFQGIVFVEQRQVAACLAKILSAISPLKGMIRCMDLVGHNPPTDTLKSVAARKQNEVLRQFRDKTINLRKPHHSKFIYRFLNSHDRL
jgi:endoribonuclease Dicer